MKNVIELFEATAAKYPDKKALGYQDQEVTFAQMRHTARCLATRIKEEAGKNNPVAVIVNRGLDTAVLFLAVLYSGNYYIPVDPDMPVNKIQMELSNSGTQMIIMDPANADLVASLDFSGISITLADASNTEAELPDTDADDPIYMVYTSGSTGTPKGVLKSHGAVISFIETFAAHFGLDESEVIGNQTPFFFDASAKDFYLMLYTGATMEVIPSEMFIFPLRLVEYMNDRQISYICWVPTALSIVVQMKTFQKILPTTLKHVFFVGEVFPIKQLRTWLETLPELQYVNLYGSTEISGISCYYELDTAKQYESLPMGKGLPNCDVFLWEDGKRITGTEEIGEVCVISPALALEYYKDPDKTAATFVMMEQPDGSVKRVLKTGDFARYDENGDLVFVTRKDFQIKHMGRRIELGEIEAVADSIEDIQRCCCLYNSEKKRIVLFCELIPGSDWDKKAVMHELRNRLTDYMLPGKVVVMEQMPFNANGKINRTALKEML